MGEFKNEVEQELLSERGEFSLFFVKEFNGKSGKAAAQGFVFKDGTVSLRWSLPGEEGTTTSDDIKSVYKRYIYRGTFRLEWAPDSLLGELLHAKQEYTQLNQAYKELVEIHSKCLK